jgi:hypothetical protein
VIQLELPCQRWNRRRDSYRPAGEVIRTADYEVAFLDGKGSDTIARAFVETHHYSGSYPAARERGMLYERRTGNLVGAAIFSHPSTEAVLKPLPCDRLEGVELGRLVLRDSVAGNGESWFIARCFEVMRARGYRAILSHSDPVPRRTLDGRLVLPGHVGVIYQATNAVYAGRSNEELHVLKPDGTILSPRSMTKIRRWERGAAGCVEELVQCGAVPPTRIELATRDGRRAWMWREIFRTCRRLAHGGNHRYIWALDKRLNKAVHALGREDSYPFAIHTRPKQRDAEPIAEAA